MADARASRLFAKLSRELAIEDAGASEARDARGDVVNAANNIPRDVSASDGTRRGWFARVWERWGGGEATLSTSRERSTIPMSPRTERPRHQDAREEAWTYPSARMFYDAMARKGWKPDARDMEQVVKIHNAVNERAWAQVMAWERRHCESCPDPKLLKFRGRPRDFSPKARLLNFLGYKLPFDRHDWIVDRCGTEVRYVIDFYNAVPYGGAAPVAMHLDVRPALDSPSAAWDRLVVQFGWMLSGEWARGSSP